MARYFVRIGGAVGDVGEIKYGFYAPDDAYDNIGDELGVKKIDDTGVTQSDARGIAFGINSPRPPKVRISYVDKNIGADKKRSVTRVCDPDKLGRVLGGSINDLKIKVNGNEFEVASVSMAS